MAGCNQMENIRRFLERRLAEPRGIVRRILPGEWRLKPESVRSCGDKTYEFEIQRRHSGLLSFKRCRSGWWISPLSLAMGWPERPDQLMGPGVTEVKSIDDLRDHCFTAVIAFRRFWVEHGYWRARLPLGAYANCAPASARIAQLQSRVMTRVTDEEGTLEIIGFDTAWRIRGVVREGRLHICRAGTESVSRFWRWSAKHYRLAID